MKEVYRAVSSIVVRRLPVKSKVVERNITIRNITRKPTETVYLLVKKPRKHHAWQFPQGGQDKGETPVEAALRELEEECGSDLKVKLVDDDMPAGSYMYKFPKDFKRWDDSIGAKVSFFRADYCDGQCQPDGKEIIDFAWLSKKEIENYIHPDYKQAIGGFLD